MRRLEDKILIVVTLLCSQAVFADTGPDYLDNEAEEEPLANAYELYKLPFVKRREVDMHLRSYYLERNIDDAVDLQDLAVGGWVNVVSHLKDDRFTIGATAYTSQKVIGDSDKGDTGLLQDNHESFSGISQIYGLYAVERIAIKAGRYSVNIPYVNQSDIRMIPQTFQGIETVVNISEDWKVGAGVLDKIKDRTDVSFKPLYEKAGLDEKHKVSIVGSIYTPTKGDLIGAYFIHAPEYMDTTYLALSKRFSQSEQQFWKLSAQYTHQESIGNQLDGDFNLDHFGAKAVFGLGAFRFSSAYTQYTRADALRKPWGSIPGYTSVIVKDFDRPGEKAWLVDASVKFDEWGAKGLKLDAKYIKGDTPECGRSASPDQDEIDVTLEYGPAHLLPGLKLRLRQAWITQEDSCMGNDATDLQDVRFIVDYQISI